MEAILGLDIRRGFEDLAKLPLTRTEIDFRTPENAAKKRDLARVEYAVPLQAHLRAVTNRRRCDPRCGITSGTFESCATVPGWEYCTNHAMSNGPEEAKRRCSKYSFIFLLNAMLTSLR